MYKEAGDRPFHVVTKSGNQTVKIPFVETIDFFQYFEVSKLRELLGFSSDNSDNLQDTKNEMTIVCLRYDVSDLFMALIVPNKQITAKDLLDKVSWQLIKMAAANSKKTFVEVSLPKFALDKNYIMVKGMREGNRPGLFLKEQLDLSGISPEEVKIYFFVK